MIFLLSSSSDAVKRVESTDLLYPDHRRKTEIKSMFRS